LLQILFQLWTCGLGQPGEKLCLIQAASRLN